MKVNFVYILIVVPSIIQARIPTRFHSRDSFPMPEFRMPRIGMPTLMHTYRGESDIPTLIMPTMRQFRRLPPMPEPSEMLPMPEIPEMHRSDHRSHFNINGRTPYRPIFGQGSIRYHPRFGQGSNIYDSFGQEPNKFRKSSDDIPFEPDSFDAFSKDISFEADDSSLCLRCEDLTSECEIVDRPVGGILIFRNRICKAENGNILSSVERLMENKDGLTQINKRKVQIE